MQISKEELKELMVETAEIAVKKAMRITRDLTINEACNELGTSHVTLRNWIKNGTLKAEMIRNKWYISRAEVDRIAPLVHELKFGRK